jgi:hypothetical protein
MIVATHPHRKRSRTMKLDNEMAKHWFALPLALRRRWWEETEYGKKEPSEKLKREVAEAVEEKTSVR